MAKILGTDSITSCIPKMVELQDEFVINGQVYSKINMAPKAFQTLPFNDVATGLLDPIMYDSAYITNAKTAGTTPRSQDSILVDSSDSNVTYILSNTNGVSCYFFKVTKTANGSKLERSLIINGYASNYGGYSKIIDQDDRFVYVFTSITSIDSSSYGNRISKIDKTTMSITHAKLSTGRSTVLHCDNINIFVASIYDYCNLKIDKYSRESCVVKSIYSEKLTSSSGVYSVKAVINEFEINGNELSFHYFIDDFASSGVHRLIAKKCLVNVLTDKVDIENVDIDFNGIDSNALFIPANMNNNLLIIEQMKITSGESKYITLVPYCIGGLEVDPLINNIYTFEIFPDGSLIMVDKFSLSVGYKTLLSFNNNHSLILASGSCATFFKWDDTIKRFRETGNYQNNISFVSRDMNNTIWIQNSDTSVEQFSPTIPTEIFVNFEKDVYEYDGEDIATNLIAYTRNFNGQYVQSSLTLTLTGSCCFAINGQKTLTLSTSGSGIIKIPIIIKSSSLIGINTFVN